MEHTENQHQPWWRREWFWLSYVCIFVISFAVMLVLQSAPVFADPDSFYHTKMALLLRDEGIHRDFRWLDMTTLGTHYTDQHFLYHLLLIPFVTVFSPLIGMKVATVFFGAALFTVIYWFLRSFSVRWAFVYPLVLLFIRPFTFRIALAKAPSTSLIILIIGIAWIFRYQLRRLFWLAFAYVWYYGGFPLLGVAATVSATMSAIHNRVHRQMPGHRFLANLRALIAPRGAHRSRLSLNVLMLTVVVGGLLAGVVFNPFFPKNIGFYEQQLVNIGIINYKDKIGVGAEWYSYNLGELLANGAFATLLVLVAALGIIFRFKAQSKRTWTLAILALFFFLLTLKSRRYVEYYIPFSVLFAAFSISDSVSGSSGSRLLVELRGFVTKTTWGRVIGGIFGLYLAVGVGFVAGRDFSAERKDLRSGYGLQELAPASRWLAAHTPENARIVHSDWDEFPVLFYHNTHNRYIIGLDPTFLYKANPDTYWTWANLTLGKYDGDVYRAVTETLGARYVFLTNDHVGMDALIQRDGRFTKVYEDSEATIYRADTETSS